MAEITTPASRFSFTTLIVRIAQSIGLIRASISISKSQLAILVYFNIGPVKKIILSHFSRISVLINRQKVISDTIGKILKDNPMLGSLFWNISIDGSGILIRIIEVESLPGTPLENSILWAIKKNFPFAMTSSHYNFRILEKNENRHRVLITVSKKEFLDSLSELLEETGLDVWQIRIGSLQLASQPGVRNYDFLYAGNDFSFAVSVKNKKLMQYHIVHENSPDKSWETLNKTWQPDLKSSQSDRLVFKSISDSSLPWLSSSSATEYSAPVPYSGSLPDPIRYELAANYIYNSFSPELLPEAKRKKAERGRIAYRLLTVFLIMQLFSPIVYWLIEKQNSILIRETSYSTIQNKINHLKEIRANIKNIQNQIIFAGKKMKSGNLNYTATLQKIASVMPPNMNLKRIKITKSGILIEGYALDIETVSNFFAEFEDEYQKTPYKTGKKGSAIEYEIKLLKKKK